MIRPVSGYRNTVYELPDLIDAAIDDKIRATAPRQEVPMIGEVRMWLGQPEEVEDPWVFANGTLVSKADYPRLFDVIRFQYADAETDDMSDTATRFRLPDLRGKYLQGVPLNSANNVYTGQTVELEFEDSVPTGSINAFYVTPVIRGK